MKKYDIIETGKSFLVVPLKNNRLDEVINDVNDYLSSFDFDGDVLFDLLITNGTSSSRLISATYKKGSLVNLKKVSAENICEIDNTSIEFLKEYHKKNKDQIIKSYLSSFQKELILGSLDESSLELA